LSPIVGLGGVRAQVVAEIDFTVTEQTQERYNPDLAAIRSEQTQEDSRIGSGVVGGVPGALSNQPPGGGVAPEQVTADTDLAAGEATSQKSGRSSKSSTRNFELDRTISHTRLAPGSIRRLSVAVLVNERQTTDAEGKSVSTALTESEMTRINALVMDAIGFSKARGDSLNVVNAPFVVPAAAEPLPALPIWEQAWVWDLVKQALGGLLVLFLVFGVIRPAFKDMNKVPANENDVAAGEMSADQAVSADGSNAIAQLTTASEDMEEQMTNVRSLIQQDPALVAQVVKNWTAGDA
jgi:flagellar M-ring protein FliF